MKLTLTKGIRALGVRNDVHSRVARTILADKDEKRYIFALIWHF